MGTRNAYNQTFKKHGWKCYYCNADLLYVHKYHKKEGFKLIEKTQQHVKYLLDGVEYSGLLGTIEHIVPRFLGGKTLKDNLRPSCSYCNTAQARRLQYFLRFTRNLHWRLSKNELRKLKNDILSVYQLRDLELAQLLVDGKCPFPAELFHRVLDIKCPLCQAYHENSSKIFEVV